MPKVALTSITADQLQAYLLDPEKNPLPVGTEDQFQRLQTIAQYLNQYPSDSQIKQLIKAQYRISENQIRADIKLARELFKSRFDFDWDFMRAWEIKDQLELVRKAREKGDLKMWNDSKKVLHTLIGERPEAVGGSRLDGIVVGLTVSVGGKEKVIPFTDPRIKDVPFVDIVDEAEQNLDTEDAERIMNS